MAIKRYSGDRFTGLSSDTKPTGVEAGAIFTETDTNTLYQFDGSSWNELAYASTNHTHTESDITDLGNYMPKSGGVFTGRIDVVRDGKSIRLSHSTLNNGTTAGQIDFDSSTTRMATIQGYREFSTTGQLRFFTNKGGSYTETARMASGLEVFGDLTAVGGTFSSNVNVNSNYVSINHTANLADGLRLVNTGATNSPRLMFESNSATGFAIGEFGGTLDFRYASSAGSSSGTTGMSMDGSGNVTIVGNISSTSGYLYLNNTPTSNWGLRLDSNNSNYSGFWNSSDSYQLYLRESGGNTGVFFTGVFSQTSYVRSRLVVGKTSSQRTSAFSVDSNEPDNSAEFGEGSRAMFIASNGWGNSAMIGWNLYHNDTGSNNIFNHLYYNTDAGANSAGGAAIGVNNNGAGGFFVYTAPVSTGAGTLAPVVQRLNIPHSGDITLTPAADLRVNGGLDVTGVAVSRSRFDTYNISQGDDIIRAGDASIGNLIWRVQRDSSSNRVNYYTFGNNPHVFNGRVIGQGAEFTDSVRVGNGQPILWYEAGTANSLVNADARVDATSEARLHWFVRNDSGTAVGYKAAWYSGARYYNWTTLSDGVELSNTAGSTRFRIEADPANSTETWNPILQFAQDGNLVRAEIGMTGNAGQGFSGASYTGTTQNSLLISHTTNNGDIQFGFSSSVVMTLSNGGNLDIDGTFTSGGVNTFNGDVNMSSVDARINIGIGGNVGPHGMYFYDSNNTVGLQMVYRTTPETLLIENSSSVIQWEIDKSGNVEANNFTATSDARFKSNEKHIRNARQSLRNINVYSFNKKGFDRVMAGYFAQNVAEHTEGVVRVHEKNGLKDYHSMELFGMQAYNTAAIKELDRAVISNEQRIKQLEKELKELRGN